MRAYLFVYIVILFLFGGVESKVRFNSQYETPHGIRLADITGDGISEFVVLDGNKIYVTTTEYTVHGLIYHKLPTTASRLVFGKFTGGASDIVCAQETSLNRLDCYVISSSLSSLTWWWHQTDFIGSKQAFVGDFDGDGKEDILVYNPSLGTFSVYKWSTTSSIFVLMTNWVPGNLGTGVNFNMQVRVGNFFGTSRTDVVLYNPTTGKAMAYAAVYDFVNAKNTFWWSFNTGDGWGYPNEELVVADVDGDNIDDLVLHDKVAGDYYSFHVIYDPSYNGMLGMEVYGGDIHYGPNTRLFFTKLKINTTEDGGRTNRRDDSLVYSINDVMWVRADARHDGVQQTYTWMYTQYPLLLNQDQDGDAILTKHELGGYDPDNNGVSNCPLHTYGASPFYKDIFVEADYMVGPIVGISYKMLPASISNVVTSFANKGINMHIFSGNAVSYQSNLGGSSFDWVTHFDPIKIANFDADRWKFFHYCLFAKQYNNSLSAGLSRDIPASDFIVTLGSNYVSVPWQSATFVHELGHNLGLKHGGVDHVNHKPNFLSVMNYNFHLGVYKNSQYQYIYADTNCNSLNENFLNENTGVVCTTDGGSYYTFIKSANKWAPINQGFDWNQNNVISGTVSVDANADGYKYILPATYNEYFFLNFGGGHVGDAAAKRFDSVGQGYYDEPPITEIPEHPVELTERIERQMEDTIPHDGTQFLTSTRGYPESIKYKKEAFTAKPSLMARAARLRTLVMLPNIEDAGSQPMAREVEVVEEIETDELPEGAAVNPELSL